MKASVQWLQGNGGVLRVHTGEGVIPWPWSWACTIDVEGNTAKLYGVVRAPTTEELVCIRETFKRMGIEWAEWERDKPRGVRNVRVRVR